MAAEKSQRRVLVRWTALRGLAALIIFFLITLLLEYIIVQSFIGLGVIDEKKATFPLVGSVSITISPLFHLIPIGVIIVLMASWIYLTRHVAARPSRIEVQRKPFQKMRKPQRLKTLRGFFKKVDNAFTSGYERLRNVVLESRVATYLERRFGFAKVAVKTALTVLLVFLAFVLLITVLAYPWLVQSSVLGFLEWNTSFHSFILATLYGTQTIAQALAPLGGLAAAINNALLATSPGIRATLAGFGAITQSLVSLDSLGKYVVVQNLAAWLSGLIAVGYGQFYGKVTRFVRRR